MTKHGSCAPRAPETLSRRAQRFLEVHGLLLPRLDVEPHREEWLRYGIPSVQIDRVAAFQKRWGGIALPPSPFYEGGPRILDADVPEGSADEGWWFPAGDGRVSMAYGFMIGPDGDFGIHADRWTSLHAGVDGWVESLALAHHAAFWSQSITKITGCAVDDLDLDSYEPVPEVQGITDNWWRGRDTLIAVYRGEAECLAAPECRTAHIYRELGDWCRSTT
ncbi:hypothetical protein [Streptomyces sp. NPDC087300]|uniref:hypothetical protein n=1 Tax=Streptomyces sp. NPDC087300 TaxID=3365780 RepID=UPI00380D4798